MTAKKPAGAKALAPKQSSPPAALRNCFPRAERVTWMLLRDEGGFRLWRSTVTRAGPQKPAINYHVTSGDELVFKSLPDNLEHASIDFEQAKVVPAQLERARSRPTVTAANPFMTEPDVYATLRRLASARERLGLVAQLRAHASTLLASAVLRTPIAGLRISHLAAEAGAAPSTWQLDDNDSAVVFCLAMDRSIATAAEVQAADMLRACVNAEELGDIPEFLDMVVGRRHREAQRVRARAEAKFDAATEKTIAREYRAAAGQRGTVKELARQHGVTTQAIRDIARRNPD